MYEVQNTKTGEKLAAKVITKNDEEDKYKEMVNNEIQILLRSNHPTIVKFIGYSFKDFFNQQNVIIFTELAQKGSLEKYLSNAKKGLADSFYDNTCRQIILIGIARGMMYLHQNDIIHRDLKPGNVLLDEKMHPLITDFGLSKTQYLYTTGQTAGIGTSIYKAPEIINGNRYSAKVDVYAFAILMYEIVTDSYPYPLLVEGVITPFQLEQQILKENMRPTFDVPVKESIKNLIQKCWSKNPNERPTFESIFKKLAYNCENVDDSIFNEYDYDYDENDKYYLDGVNVEQVIEYADSIKSNFSLEEENKELKKKLEDANKKNELSMNPLNKEKSAKIDNLKKDKEGLNMKPSTDTKSRPPLAGLKKYRPMQSTNIVSNTPRIANRSIPRNVFDMKLSSYAKIQRSLCELKPDSNDSDIDQLISQIPKNFLKQKDDLKVICELFAHFSFFCSVKKKRIAIKLFDKIKNPIKELLNDESNFFWLITGKLLFFKYWMYENGMISIEQIIFGAQRTGSKSIIEYFLPEIYSLKREIFDKEIQFKYQKPFSQNSIDEIKEIRSKYLKWLLKSADFNDPMYKEIDKDPLRLAIKKDDIDSFKQIYSKSKLTVNSTITDTLFCDYIFYDQSETLLVFAAFYGSNKIFKFLINKGIDESSYQILIQSCLSSNNKEMFQLLMNKVDENAKKTLLISSIYQWNLELTDSELKKPIHEYFQKATFSLENLAELFPIISATFLSYNFIFYESTLANFFRNNPHFIQGNIHQIIKKSFKERSCFFAKEMMKNRHFLTEKLLKTAIRNQSMNI